MARGSSHGAARVGVLAATVLLVALTVAWTVVAPPFRAPDETVHVSTSWRLASGGGYPPPGTAHVDYAVVLSYKYVRYCGNRCRTPIGVRPAGLPRPTMAQLRASGVPRFKVPMDQMTQHPPGYYSLMAGSIAVLDLADTDPATALLVLRLVSVLLLLPVPALCYLTARELALDRPVAVVSAFLPAAWVELTHISGSVNNGTPLVLETALLSWLLMRVTHGDMALRTAGGVGATLTAALLTKGLALPLVLLTFLAYVLGARRFGLRPATRAGLVAGVVATPGLVWWVGNYLRYGSVQPSDFAPLGGSPQSLRQLPEWAASFFDTFSRTLSYSLGWAENGLPGPVHRTLTLALLALLVVGTVRLRWQLAEVLLLHATWVLPLALVCYGSVAMWLHSGAVRAAQGRYIAPGVVALSVVLAAAVVRSRVIGVVVPALCAVVAGLGLAGGLSLFWAGATMSERVAALDSWWPSGRLLLMAATGAAVAATVVGTWACLAVNHRPAR